MRTGYVYKITSPTNKIYIGSTINIKRRFAAYKSYQCKAQIKVYNSFIKYKVENHIFEIVWEGNVDEMLFQEFTFGKLFDVLNRNKGLNLKLPKVNDTYKAFSEEMIEKMSNSAKGKIISRQARDKISAFHKGKITSKETKEKMSLVAKGRVITKEAKQKMSLAKLGKKHNLQSRLNNSNGHKKPVIQYDLQNNIIKYWCSADIASKELKIQACHIAACCKFKRKTCGGFKWSYNIKINKNE